MPPILILDVAGGGGGGGGDQGNYYYNDCYVVLPSTAVQVIGNLRETCTVPVHSCSYDSECYRLSIRFSDYGLQRCFVDASPRSD